MTSSFKDHFSESSDRYARYRPTYPAELLSYLASVAPSTARAWDCATGNGQVAIALAAHFDSVVATDASAEQLAASQAHARVEYATARAEVSGLESGSVDLVTVAQAYHWFDAPQFHAEAQRVLRPDGVLAVWCYQACQVNSDIEAAVEYLYTDLIGPFWPPERVMIEDGYRQVVLPGESLPAPAFEMSLDWTASDMLGYLRTWSASRRYQAEHGDDPVAKIETRLREAWGEGVRTVRWPLHLKISRPNAVD